MILLLARFALLVALLVFAVALLRLLRTGGGDQGA